MREAVLAPLGRAFAKRPFDLKAARSAAQKVKDELGEGAFTEACAIGGAAELVSKTVDVVGKQPMNSTLITIVASVMALIRSIASLFMK